MKQLDSTYRLQLSPQYTFDELEKIMDYLEELGVATIYAAPFFQAREGSTHGYDVLDPFTISKGIGNLKQFQGISERLNEKKMSWLQDIVPNHMAYSGENPWLKDIFELGPASRFYNFFDINWEYKSLNKVMAPFLGGTLDEVLEKSELKFGFDATGFSLNYYDNKYPLSVRSYAEILSRTGEKDLKDKLSDFSGTDEKWQDLKVSFLRKVDNDSQLKEKIIAVIDEINNFREEIEKILELQYYLPTHWKKTENEINYRRFFTINDLICLRMEDPKVFETYHYYIKELCEAGLINGLRIDHIDGLFDPEGYLHQLRNLVGKDFYIAVEKILEADEKLPDHWPVKETSGYDFLAQVNHLFTQAANEPQFTEGYKKIFPEVEDYEALVYEKKLFILKERMGGELHNLWVLLKENDLLEEDSAQLEEKWKEVLSAFLAAFPVYRIYPKNFPLENSEKEIIEAAYTKAIDNFPQQQKELEFLKKLFLGEAGKDKSKMMYFLQRCQQFSGPLAAKGVEDTSFYIYNRLVSHNEVGDSPENFGISVMDFHSKMLQRKNELSQSINATATHDTKRGEDARMRLNVLSELPQVWFSKVEEWKEINSEIRKDKQVPGPNDEYFIYQTLIGGMPFTEEADFLSRTCDYIQKVLREAKVHSNWAQPNEAYEKGTFEFIEDILKHEKFRKSFDPFFRKVAGYGVIKSLGQALIKITTPGIPDTYQGTELWDLSYVDPDNRRPVDYDLRKNYLSDFKNFNQDNLKEEISSLTEYYSDGKLKMFLIHNALRERRLKVKVFKEGNYIPLNLSGKNSENFICYARNSGEDWYLIIVPVLVTQIFDYKNLTPNPDVLKNIIIEFGENLPDKWTNVLTGEAIAVNKTLSLTDLFSHFPVAFLKNKS